MPFFYMDRYYLIFVIPALILAFLAQANVKSTFSKYAKQFSRRGYTAAQVARLILDKNNLQMVEILQVGGKLTDFYDPKSNSISLSDDVYASPSVASIGVAAHEVGHAIQHGTGYAPIKIRNFFVPIANIGSTISIPIAIAGFIFGMRPLVEIGILLFSMIVLFQIITLPVEFNASRRAIDSIETFGILSPDEVGGAKKVLFAAALTYVAATITAIANLLRLMALFNDRS